MSEFKSPFFERQLLEAEAAVDRAYRRAAEHLLAPIPAIQRAAFGPVRQVPVNPLDVSIDGWTLRDLIAADQNRRRGECGLVVVGPFTPAQRAAISAHWSAELRARIVAGREAERNQVRVDLEVDGW